MTAITTNPTRPTNPSSSTPTGPTPTSPVPTSTDPPELSTVPRPLPPTTNADYTAQPPDPSVLDRPLPRRPRLLPGLPVLRRAPGELQLGLDRRHAVVLSGLPEVLGDLLRSLDGRHTGEELLARAGPAAQALLHQVLLGLVDIGLVEDAATADRATAGSISQLSADRTAWALRTGQPRASSGQYRDPAVVVVYGSGRMAVAMAALLSAAGVGRIHASADGVVQPEDTGCGYLDEDIGQPRAGASDRAAHRSASHVRTGPLGPRQRPDLVVLADAVVADPQLLARLTAGGLPHLPVYVSEGVGTVGPLIIPGQAGCLHCIDRDNTDKDSCWPVLATQLAGQPRPADLATVQATAGFAAGQVLRFLHGPRDGADELPVRGAAIEIDSFTGEVRPVPRPPHQNCSCGVVRTRPTRPAGPIPSRAAAGAVGQSELSGQHASHREASMRQRA